jgi:RHS repeat-associated protein
VTRVVTPNGAATGFTVNGFGEARVESSPDRGTLTRSFDEAGNRVSETDARGITTHYRFDALNRLISIDRPGTLDDVTYTWDAGAGCSHGVGRLCAVSDASGTHGFAYDARGNLIGHGYRLLAVDYRQEWRFDASDRLVAASLPTGVRLVWRHDGAGRPAGVWRRVGGEDFPLVTVTARSAAGPVRRLAFGNGVTVERTLNAGGRLRAQAADDRASLARGGPGGGAYIDGVTVVPPVRTLPLPWPALLVLVALLLRIGLMASGRRASDSPLLLVALTDGVLLALLLSPGSVEALALSYGFDERGNVVSRRFDGTLQTFGHDALDRLVSETDPSLTQSFVLDANGNRLRDGQGAYRLAPASNRLTANPFGPVRKDAAGHTEEDAHYRYTWSAAGDLVAVRAGLHAGLAPDTPIASYRYDHRHLRVTKTVTGPTTVFHHDEQGQLIAETRATGEPLRSYVWLEGAPVAIIEHAALTGGPERTLYLETDPLNTPRAASDDQGRTVWRWHGDAFGASRPEEDPDGDRRRTVIPLRFPGQYADEETGLNYNWHRYYEPWTGRYLSSDPIGLEGGTNLYTYVDAAPLDDYDFEGLARGGSRRGGSPYPRGTLGNPYGDPVLRNDPSLLRPHGHHSDPIFMGGSRKQVLTEYLPPKHYHLHRLLNDFLRQQTNPRGDHMRPQRGNKGEDIRENFTREQRLDALRRFHEQYGDLFPEAARDFFNQHPHLRFCD